MPVEPDYDTILRAMKWATSYGTTEIRSIDKYRGRITAGYFRDPLEAANAIMQHDSGMIKGIYCTLNPTVPQIYQRCSSRLETAYVGTLTKDPEILCRREILLDFDPERESDTSATDEQHDMAIARTREAVEWLAYDCGFPLAALIDSGNGGHGRIRLDPLRNDLDSAILVKNCLSIIGTKFNDNLVKLDLKVFNASRICRIPGTVARKGDGIEAEYPHRLSKIIRPFDLDDLSHEVLKEFVAKHHTEPVRVNGNRALAERPDGEAKYSNLNRQARQQIHGWVPHLLGQYVREYEGGYRITSENLGRDLEEDIAILPGGGIKDHGVADMGDPTEGRRSPVALVAFVLEVSKDEAAKQIANVLGIASSEFSTLEQPLPVGSTMIAMPGSLLGQDDAELASPTFYNSIRQRPIKEIKYLIDRLLVLNTHTVMSGESKAGKTTFAYELVLHVLFGRPFLGKKVERANVLYLALEEREDRFHRKMQSQLETLGRGMWPDLTETEIEEAFSGLAFVTRSSKLQDGKAKTLPVGFRGAEEIRKLLREYQEKWPGKPWLLVIEPVILFSEERLMTRNLNKSEYEQIEIINDIIREEEFTCAILTVKHNRKSPAGGSRGGGNMMDNVAGSVAQLGAPDATILLSNKEYYNFKGEPAWIMVQSRDFGKEQFPIISNGVSWIKPPPGMDIPPFEEYIKSDRQGPGARKIDPYLDAKILSELAKEIEGLSCREMSERFNVSEQIVRRTVDGLESNGRLTRHRNDGMRAGLYRLAEPVALPNTILRDIL